MLVGALGWLVFALMFLEGDRRGAPAVLAVSLVAFAGGWLLAGLPAPHPRLADGEAPIAELSGPLWRVILTQRRVIYTSTLARRRSFAYADIAAVTGGEHSPHYFEDFRLGIVIETRDGRRRWMWMPDRYTEVADAINKQLRADRSGAGIRR